MKTLSIIACSILLSACASQQVAPITSVDETLVPLKTDISSQELLLTFKRQDAIGSLSILRSCEISTFELSNTKDDVSMLNVRTFKFPKFQQSLKTIVKRDNVIYAKSTVDLVSKSEFIDAQLYSLDNLIEEIINENVICQSRLRVLKSREFVRSSPKVRTNKTTYTTSYEEEP